MYVARIPAPNVTEPGATEDSPRQDLLRIYEQAKTIAVVGASGDERKAAHGIPKYLQSQGYHIVPVNPGSGEILDERRDRRVESNFTSLTVLFEGCHYPGKQVGFL